MFFDDQCFNELNVQFHSNSFIQKCPAIILQRFLQSFQKLCSCSEIIFVGLVETSEA